MAVPLSSTVLLCEDIVSCRLTIDQDTGTIIDSISRTNKRWNDSDYMTMQLPFDSPSAVIANFYGTSNDLAEDSESKAAPGSGYTALDALQMNLYWVLQVKDLLLALTLLHS